MTGEIDIDHRMGGFHLQVKARLGPGITGLFGPSGSGKSTVLRCVAGLLRPDRGHISVRGETLLDRQNELDTPPHRRNIGTVFQDPRLFPHLSVERNLRYGMGRLGGETSFDEIVDLLDVRPLLPRRPAGLSGGEAQRVALGRALLSGPRLLLLDEPLSALDAGLKASILPYLERVRDISGVPMLYVSHDIDEVTRLADDILLIERGHLTEAGAVSEVLSHAESDIAGGLLTVQVVSYDAQDDLTAVALAGRTLWLPQRIGAPGDSLRLRIDARDVTLSCHEPEGLSALNVLPVQVDAISLHEGASALVRLTCDGQAFAARITKRSLTALEFQPGDTVFAILKSMSALPTRLGAPHQP